MDNDKQEFEVKSVDSLLNRLGFESYKLKRYDSPDVFAEFTSDRHPPFQIGIEVRTLQADEDANGSTLRKFNNDWCQIIEKVEKNLKKEGMDFYQCRVDFRDRSYHCLDNLDERQLVEELTSVGKMLSQSTSLKFPLEQSFPLLNNLLYSIKVIKLSTDSYKWFPSHLKTGVITDLTDTVIKSIKEKSLKAAKYNWPDAKEKWLLLVACAEGTTDIFSEIKEIKCNSLPKEIPFSAIIIWDQFSENIWIVHPQHFILCNSQSQKRDLSFFSQPLLDYSNKSDFYSTINKIT